MDSPSTNEIRISSTFTFLESTDYRAGISFIYNDGHCEPEHLCAGASQSVYARHSEATIHLTTLVVQIGHASVNE